LGITAPVHGALVLVITVDAFAQIGPATTTVIAASGKIRDGEEEECKNAQPKSK
jgi:hypothetical protein